MNHLWIIYLVAANLTGFAAMGIDKQKAVRHKWRIPEKTLFIIALLGGSLGSLAGMYFFRHKTRHLTFVIGMPVILTMQLVAGWILLR